MKIIKRNGTETDFDRSKIRTAVAKANESVPEYVRMNDIQIDNITNEVVNECEMYNRE